MTPPSTRPADLGQQAEFLGSLDVRLDLPLATVGSRAMAQWIDIWLVWGAIIVAVAAALTAGILLQPKLGDDALAVVLTVSGLLLFLLQWGYFFTFELLWQGQTPGKRIFGLRVVTLDGSPPGVVPCMVRNTLRLVDLIPGTYGIGAIAALLSERGQRLGDRVAGTVVIREDRSPATAGQGWPAGLGPGEIALLERWARRRSTLLPEHRATLAAALAAHLRSHAPGVLGEGEPLTALDALIDGEG